MHRTPPLWAQTGMLQSKQLRNLGLLRHVRDAVCFDFLKHLALGPQPTALVPMRYNGKGEPKPRLTEARRIKILRLKAKNFSKDKIAAIVGCSPGSVSYTLRRFARYHTVQDRPRTGRPRIIPARALAGLIAAIDKRKIKPRASLAACQQWLQEHHGLQIKLPTLYAALHREGLKSFSVRAKPIVSPAAVEKRLAAAEDWSKWSPTILSRCVFSDEAAVARLPHHGREVVFGKRGKPFHGGRSRPQPANVGVKVNIWAAITNRGVLAYRMYDSIMNSTLYRKILLHNLARAARKRFGTRRSWWFQQDNAPYHKERSIKKLMLGPSWKKVHVLDWPPYSPDLNIIDNFWVQLQARVAAAKPQTKEEIKNAITLAITQMNKEEPKTNYFHKLFLSFPTRCAEVKGTEGLPVDH